MNEQERQAEIARLRELANNKEHIRKHALRLAGYYLTHVGDDIAEAEIYDLDTEIFADQELLAAHKDLIERIAKDVERIGQEMIDLYVKESTKEEGKM